MLLIDTYLFSKLYKHSSYPLITVCFFEASIRLHHLCGSGRLSVKPNEYEEQSQATDPPTAHSIFVWVLLFLSI